MEIACVVWGFASFMASAMRVTGNVRCAGGATFEAGDTPFALTAIPSGAGLPTDAKGLDAKTCTGGLSGVSGTTLFELAAERQTTGVDGALEFWSVPNFARFCRGGEVCSDMAYQNK